MQFTAADRSQPSVHFFGSLKPYTTSTQSCVTVMTRDFPITVFNIIVTMKEES